MEENAIVRAEGLRKTFTLSQKQQKLEKTAEKRKVAVDGLSFSAYRGARKDRRKAQSRCRRALLLRLSRRNLRASGSQRRGQDDDAPHPLHAHPPR